MRRRPLPDAERCTAMVPPYRKGSEPFRCTLRASEGGLCKKHSRRDELATMREHLVKYAQSVTDLHTELAVAHESEKESARELRDLRAYKERTEAGLHKLSDIASMHGDILDDEMRDLGLWRDPPRLGPLEAANTAWAAENADLRAYKERTEAGLQELRDFMCERWGKAADEPKWEFIDSLDAKGCALGLWRDPPQAEVQP